ncbi:hypothetical protein M0R04_06850 [Candidatus Dojkabacteria bacterium]|jgi:hypothetical protein|nr:hypothetical protein [Candidatus Dojkabacteria bacterium]
MKVRDILIPTQTLRDLFESLSYIPQDLTWDEDEGYFSVKGEQFQATVRPATSDEEHTFSYFFDPIPKVGNVDFSMVIPGGSTQDTTGLMKSSAFKVFSSVAHVASLLTKKHGYQVLLCIAKKKHSPTNFKSRESAYEVIVDRLARNNGMTYTKLYTTPTETVFVIYHHNLRSGIAAVKRHMNKL